MKKWKVIAEDSTCMYVHAAAYLAGIATKLHEIVGLDNGWAARFNGNVVAWCADVPEMEKTAKITLTKLMEDKAFFEKVVNESNATITELEKEAASISKLNLNKLTDAELVALYCDLFDKWAEMNIWGHVVNLVDFEHFMLTNKIMAFLEKRVKAAKISRTTAEAFSILVTPTKRSRLQQQDVDFYTLLSEMQRGKNIAEKVKTHVEKYKWMQFHYDGPIILDERYFSESLASSNRQGVNGAIELEKILNHEKEIMEKQKKLAKELKLSGVELHWLEVAREFAFLKALRKDVAFEACCNSFPLIKELAKRLEITPRQVKFMSIKELKKALETRKVNANELNERARRSVVTFEDGDAHFHIGKEGEGYFARIYEEQVDKHLSELKGTPAFPGNVKGIAKILVSASDMVKFSEGDVLVSPATNPNLVGAMKIAGAIVTDEGGITCHAAIVSRELKIPCVIGTKVATKWLKDGDVVEVNAVKGIVKKL